MNGYRSVNINGMLVETSDRGFGLRRNQVVFVDGKEASVVQIGLTGFMVRYADTGSIERLENTARVTPF